VEIQGWKQEKLAKTHVLIVGIGGIGSITAMACARLGIGRITLCDCDLIEASNLNRQILYSISGIGQQKIERGLDNLASVHLLDSRIEGYDFDIFKEWKRFKELLKKADFVFNALDLPELKKLAVANLCLSLKKPMIFAGTDPINGHAGMILLQGPLGNPCYNCLTAAIYSVDEKYREWFELGRIGEHASIPVDLMNHTGNVEGKTTIYTASVVTMMGIDLMIHWLFQWNDALPNRIIVDLYNFTCETWSVTSSCQFCIE
jgi:molybdopterin/thiamine biosynthesis adenylyltransferase